MEKRPFRVRLSTGKILNLTARKPTVQENEASDQEYSAIFNRSITGGAPTRAKMRQILTKKKLIDPADEERLTQINFDVNAIDKQIRSLSKQLKDKKPEELNDYEKGIQSEIDELQKKRAPLQQEWGELREISNSFFTHTAETQAEFAQRNFLVVATTEYGEGNDGHQTGERVWPDLDALSAETEATKFNRSLYEYMMVIQDLPSDGDQLFGNPDESPIDEDADEVEGDGKEVTSNEAPTEQSREDEQSLVMR